MGPKRLVENETRLQKTIEQKEAEAREKYETLEEKNAKDIEEMKQKFDEEIESSKQLLLKTVEERDESLNNLRKQHSDLERERQMEIMNLRSEYEDKLTHLSLQKHLEEAKNEEKEFFMNKNEKLKRKLYNLQSEATREINGLKRKIAEMEKTGNKHQIQKKRLSFH